MLIKIIGVQVLLLAIGTVLRLTGVVSQDLLLGCAMVCAFNIGVCMAFLLVKD